jgi:hypothetical protein
MVGFLLGMNLCGSKSASAIRFEGFDSPPDMCTRLPVWQSPLPQTYFDFATSLLVTVLDWTGFLDRFLGGGVRESSEELEDPESESSTDNDDSMGSRHQLQVRVSKIIVIWSHDSDIIITRSSTVFALPPRQLMEVGPLYVMQKMNGLGWTWKLKGACATFYCILQYANFFYRLNSIPMKTTDLYYLS